MVMRSRPPVCSPAQPASAASAQFDLFERIIPARGQVYTQSLELWDQMPKVVLGRPRDPETGKPVPKDTRYIPTQTHEFAHDGETLFVDVAPARLKVGNSDRDVLPGLRELVCEWSIRQIAIRSQSCAEIATDAHGRLVGARFRIGAIRTDLIRHKHTYSWSEIREALLVGSGAVINLRNQAGKILARAPIFPVVALPAETDDGMAYVAFHPLVTIGIKDAIYRQLNYQTSMTLKAALARWLHRRMVHRFLQAGHTIPYTIHAQTILRDSGLCRYGRHRDRLAAVDEAIEELRDKKILLRPTGRCVGAPSSQGIGIMANRAWLDTKYELYASPGLIDDIKLANFAAKGR